jgi:MFS family permease
MPTRFYPWLVVLLLWPVALLNYLDRQMLSTAKASVVADVAGIKVHDDAGKSLENERFGNLMAAFMWVYAGLSPVGGFIADRFSRRWTVTLSLFVWSAVTFATGRAETYEQMWWLRAAMGVSEAFYFPAGLALIADFHRSDTRTRATALHQTGVYAGMALGGLGGYFADYWSWRIGFQVCGGIGIVYAVILGFVLKDPERVAGEPRADLRSSLRVLGGTPSFWLLVAYFTLPAMGAWGLRNWLPTHVATTFVLSQTASGFLATGCLTTGNVLGAILGGWLADTLSRRTDRGRIFTSAAGVLLCVPALLGVGYALDLPLLAVCVVLFGVGWGLFDVNNMPILSQIVCSRYRATGYGLMNAVSISAGAWCTIEMGKLKDAGTPFGVALAIGAGITLASVACVLLIRPKKG